ncbi:MAG: PEGA domain-containing protein [Methanomicrobiales archaeon]|nr:PEGA domain-containing protein [Methanomicrobiales archaeon]
MTVLFLLLVCGAAASAATGTIGITVFPGGGTVCLDTDCKGAPSSPGEPATITFSGVEAGCYHTLTVYDTEGYEPYSGQVFLDISGTSLAREVRLKSRPAVIQETGMLRVHISPDGGKACLDRMCELSSGDGTGSWSVDFIDVTANTPHTLTLASNGYRTYTEEVRVLPGKTTELAVTLEKLPPGSTPDTTTAPVLTTQPRPTPVPLPGWIVAIALAICGAGVLVLRRHR